MAQYTPKTWTTGETITAAELNAIEQAAAAAAVATDVNTSLATKVNSSTYTAGLAAKADTASLAAVAQTGSYTDLANKPTIPAATTDASLLTSGTLPAARIADASIADAKLVSGTALTPTERTKLTGIATGATANSSDATLLARANHTGTQAAGTITGLATVATSGAYTDLSGKPTLGTAAALAAGSASGVATLDGTGNVPAAQLNNVGKFNQATSVYNATPAGLHKVRAALGKAQAGVGLATFVCLGDSTTAGNGLTVGNRATGSHPAVLRSLLGTKGYPSGGDGFIPSWSNVDDPRVTRSAGWTQFGPSTNPGTVTSGTAGSTLTFTGLDTCVAIDIYYLKPAGAGTFSWAVDGGTATNVATAGSQTIGKVTVTGLASAIHTVVATVVSGSVWIIGVVMKKAAGILICNVATSGIKATDIAGSAYTTLQSLMVAMVPDYTQIMLGVNDFGAQNTISAYTTAMQTITTAALATGDVGYTVPLPPNTAVGPYTGTNPTFAQYVTAIYGLADTNSAQLLDMQHRWTSWATSQALGYYNATDPVHGSDLGYADLGRAELALLGV